MNISEIKKNIKSAWHEWDVIKRTEKHHCFFSAAEERDALKNRLEDIRGEIEDYFNVCPGTKKECLTLLRRILNISEKLKLSYVCPAAYDQSINIFETMKNIDRR